MQIAFSWDDGALEDLKLFELHEKYGIPGMFFVPTRNSEGKEVLASSQIQSVNHELISFGGHTDNHVYLTDINPLNVEKEISENKRYLEEVLNGYQALEHFCLPGGKYNPQIVETALKYYKTVRTADTMCFKNDSSLVKPSFHMYPRGKKSLLGNACRNRSWMEAVMVLLHPGKDYYQLIKSLIDFEAKSLEAKIIIWGHSWEIEEQNLWGTVENLMKFLTEQYADSIVNYSKVSGLENRE